MSKVIYVAGDWEERADIRDYMTRLERAGFEIALDWTDPAVFSGARELKDGETWHDVCEQNAQAVVLALQRSQVFWLLMPKRPFESVWWELGYCTALFGGDAAYPILVSGDRELGYVQLPCVLRFPVHEEAFDALCDYMKLGKAIRVKP